MNKIEKIFRDLLVDEKKYWIEEEFNLQMVIEDLKEYNYELIDIILNNKELTKEFVISIKNEKIIKVNEILDLLNFNSFWKNSFTEFENEIGLTSEKNILSIIQMLS